MTGARVVRLSAPFTACYAVRGGGVVLVDAGPPRSADRVRRAFATAGLEPTDVRLIVLTHGHWDHIGAARPVQDLTDAPIALHRGEVERLGPSGTPLPPGVGAWGQGLAALARLLPVPSVPPFDADIEIGADGLSLEPFGVAGRVVPTPGHSPGSVSVVLGSGEAFVGDLAMNRFPLTVRPARPTLAEDPRQVRDSWRRLLDLGVTTVYPAHGTPFSAAVLREGGGPTDG